MNHQVTIARQLRALARLTYGNTASRVYLGLVLAVSVFVAVDTLFVSTDDASFAGVWVFLLAAPTVFLFLLGSSVAGADAGGPAWFVYLALVVSVLVQACALGWFAGLLRGTRRSSPAHPHGA
ncbi:hypothetical protein OHB07_03555 [Streptomyces sp. NBC_00111]|uniref:SCO4225 family membrane protein n=1 Tax=unclassified Streptomyces TaxID=2593676 RepID=UPI002E3559BB|nr:hypothetical protein [Streptomyces sp. NBC_01460]